MNSDALQNRFLKQTLATKKRAINSAVMGEVGARPLFAMAMERTVRFARAIEALHDGQLVSLAMTTQKRLHAAGKQCWFTGVARLFSQAGGTDTKRGQIRKVLEDRHITQWTSDIKKSSRLLFYSEVKQSYAQEAYLSYAHRKVRRAFTRYRISDHCLRVEHDRWLTQISKKGPRKQELAIPREQRLCRRCQMGQVDDEFHIFRCGAFQELRTQYGITCDSRSDILTAVTRAHPSTMWYIYKAMTIVDKDVRSHQTRGNDHE